MSLLCIENTLGLESFWKFSYNIEYILLLVNSYILQNYISIAYSPFWINTVIEFSSVYTGSSFEGLSWGSGSSSSSKAGLSILLALE